jgi:hypothetical protein
MIHVDRYCRREAHEVRVRAVGVEDCGLSRLWRLHAGCRCTVEIVVT